MKLHGTFTIYSPLTLGHLASNADSEEAQNTFMIKTLLDGAIEKLTRAQLDQLDENPLAFEDNLQEGINLLKKLRGSL